MNTFYNSLPWPLFLLISFGSGLFIFLYYSKNFFKHTVFSAVGMILIGVSALLVGLLRTNTEFQFHLSEKHIYTIVYCLVPTGAILNIIGAFIYNIGNRKRRKILVLCSAFIVLFMFYIFMLLIFYG